ncbi:purple acid phosphatase 3-like [Impatiens glandulifera]|uniref:purple acid phosphatase 3-like n=1 Tax=Impatiens glandulifera TaxID=253017 RepID=UPI001FB0F0DC|nr:purple acid phosphatase 3-like [Impatiens glandulifera]
MGLIGAKLDIDFIISTGDNFYDSGLTGENDPAFEESFTNIYTAPSLQKQWYSVLGNHDYRGNALAQLSPFLREKDSKWLCLRSFIVNAAETVDFFFVDTTPFQDKYFSDPDQNYDWRGVLPREKYLTDVLKDLDLALKESTSNWKIVVGHHTIKSAGSHGETLELVQKLLPILQANNVDLYINGHDHCLEHITSSDSPLHFVTSGGGSKAWRGEYHWMHDPNEVKFYYDGQGFISLEITESEIVIFFYDIDGIVLHKFNVVKPLHAVL